MCKSLLITTCRWHALNLIHQMVVVSITFPFLIFFATFITVKFYDYVDNLIYPLGQKVSLEQRALNVAEILGATSLHFFII